MSGLAPKTWRFSPSLPTVPKCEIQTSQLQTQLYLRRNTPKHRRFRQVIDGKADPGPCTIGDAGKCKKSPAFKLYPLPNKNIEITETKRHKATPASRLE
ncbi:hypothetical protein J6590_083102 [Homalodisca vitripennis]|nr:hypothetical protein J6590_083102 [Homalodisca vitripennis]